MDNSRQLNAHNIDEIYDLMTRAQATQQVANLRPHADTAAFSESDDFAVLMQYLRILWKRKWLLALTMLLGSFVAIAVSLGMTPLYRAKTTVEIQNIQEPFGSRAVAADATLLTHAQLIRTRPMIDRTRSKLENKNAQPFETSGPLAFIRSL